MLKIISSKIYQELVGIKEKYAGSLIEISRLKQKNEEIIDKIDTLMAAEANAVPAEIESLKRDIESLKARRDKKERGMNEQINELANSIALKKTELEILKDEVECFDELQTINTFVQNMDDATSQLIKFQIEKNKEKQRTMIKNGQVYTLGNDLDCIGRSKNEAYRKKTAKFLLTTFNAEVDNLIAACKRSNVATTYKKIDKWFIKVNKFGEETFVSLSPNYLELRLEELKLVFDYH